MISMSLFAVFSPLAVEPKIAILFTPNLFSSTSKFCLTTVMCALAFVGMVDFKLVHYNMEIVVLKKSLL